jgi:hypothetical protein
MPKKAMLGLAILLSMISAAAEEYVKSGRPCLSDICIGDELSALSKIEWDPVRVPFTSKAAASYALPDEEMKKITVKFAPASAPAVRNAGSYIASNAFDNAGISKLAKVSGFCEPVILSGSFTSPGGHKTHVVLNVATADSPSVATWRVMSITRTFPAEYTKAQVGELATALKQRYAEVKQGSLDMKVPVWDFSIYTRKLTLQAPMENSGKVRDKLRQYPGCGKPLAID